MEEGFVLEGSVLYVAIVVPVLAGMLVCYRRSMFSRLLIVAAAIIIVSVGVGSVYAGAQRQTVGVCLAPARAIYRLFRGIVPARNDFWHHLGVSQQETDPLDMNHLQRPPSAQPTSRTRQSRFVSCPIAFNIQNGNIHPL
jgi:hypothetical protein